MVSQPSVLVLAGGRILDSRPLQILLSLLVGALIGYQAPNLALALLIFAGVSIIGGLCLLEINWAIWLLILLSPFHFALKAVTSSGVVDVWRELFFLLILASWLLQVLLGKRPPPQLSVLNLVVAGYLLWGVVAILNSASLLVGLAGFRFIFSFVPLYFVASSTITNEKEVKRFVAAILASGVVVALIAILQFILVKLLGVLEKGTSIDFARPVAGAAKAAGIPWERATSVFLGPNELGVFLAICLTLGCSYYWSAERRKRHPWLLLLVLAIMGMGLLASMSRSSMLGLVVALLTLTLVKRRVGPVVVLCLAGIVLLAVASVYLEALFRPAYELSDPYFSQTWQEALTSRMVWRSPIMGHGYGFTHSVAEKLGIDTSSLLDISGVDIYAILAIAQIGLVGFSLFLLGWVLFVRNAYRGARRPDRSEFMKDTAAGICAAFLGIMVTSAHAAAWEYVSFAAGYYLLAAIASWTGDRQTKTSQDHREEGDGPVGSQDARVGVPQGGAR